MLSPRNTLALAFAVAALSACAEGSRSYSTPERSGSYGSSASINDDDRGPQARNANAYMRQ